MSVLPASNVKRLIHERAGDLRVSADAVGAATDAAADYLQRLGERAAGIARSYARKTIMPEDIDAARKQLGD